MSFCSLCEVTFNPVSYIQSKYFWGTSQGFGIWDRNADIEKAVERNSKERNRHHLVFQSRLPGFQSSSLLFWRIVQHSNWTYCHNDFRIQPQCSLKFISLFFVTVLLKKKKNEKEKKKEKKSLGRSLWFLQFSGFSKTFFTLLFFLTFLC